MGSRTLPRSPSRSLWHGRPGERRAAGSEEAADPPTVILVSRSQDESPQTGSFGRYARTQEWQSSGHLFGEPGAARAWGLTASGERALGTGLKPRV
jgi:hypothetical protein